MSKTNYKRYYFCILFFIVLFISLIYAALHPNFYVFMFPAIITAFFLEGLYYWGVFSKEESESKTKEWKYITQPYIVISSVEEAHLNSLGYIYLREGDTFLCIEDFYMQASENGDKAFSKGKVYKISEVADDCVLFRDDQNNDHWMYSENRMQGKEPWGSRYSAYFPHV